MSPTSITTPAERDRVPALDGLRGVAALMVVVYHFYVIPETQSTRLVDTVVFKIAQTGWAGVDLFFVLSGFLITGILLNAKPGSGYFRTFYARRMLRIFPLYYLSLIVLLFMLAVLPWFARQQSMRELRDTQLWFWTYLINVRVAFAPLAKTGFATGHFWSLAIEEQFYLLWPAVVLICSRRVLGFVCIACIATALAFRVAIVHEAFPRLIPQLAATTLMPARMDGLAIGALIALASRDRHQLEAVAKRWLRPLVVIGLGILVLLAALTKERTLSADDSWVLTVGFSALDALAAAAIVAALTGRTGSLFNRTLTQPVLTTVGRYSYGLYVVHLPVAVFMLTRYTETNTFMLVGGSDIPARLAFVFVGVSLSLSVAWVSWHLLESQVLKLKRYFPYGAAIDTAPGRARSDGPMPLPGAEVRP